MSINPKEDQHRLPRFLRPLFWEYDFKDLYWPKDRDLVIQKVLINGDWQAVRWLRGLELDQGLTEWIVKRRGRGLDPRQLRFWEIMLELKHSTVSQWLEEMKIDPWQARAKPKTGTRGA